MFLCERNGTCAHLPTNALEVYDVTGAGDVALSVIGLCLVAGVQGVAAGRIANIAAGLEVGKQGANIISRDELTSALVGEDHESESKVMLLKILLKNSHDIARPGTPCPLRMVSSVHCIRRTFVCCSLRDREETFLWSPSLEIALMRA